MNTALLHARRCFVMVTAVLLVACADESPLAMTDGKPAPQLGVSAAAEMNQMLATLRRVTARYHNLDAAVADGFVPLHPCEERPGEGPVGALYVHFGRLLDGIIDPETPDALLYEPAKNGREKFVGVELAVPYLMWSDPAPPEFLGARFQREDEFGVFALHVWVWRHNPEGMFAESNPNVSCGTD